MIQHKYSLVAYKPKLLLHKFRYSWEFTAFAFQFNQKDIEVLKHMKGFFERLRFCKCFAMKRRENRGKNELKGVEFTGCE
ncbi:CLUMA_CG019359, isoform A [Clunio marinus]|uniref:CLUMA_CG019359, isoform A n=1 Tax=Clunio marinus TaxID=568069 RepID=A0A1J1J1J8_9DIPT|nr:CLUMA_CG019359, isoform A [Clunio marinus]